MMLNYLRLVVLAAVIVALSVATAPSQKTAATRSASRSSQVGARQKSRLQTVQFQSKLAGKVLPYNVILPVDYNYGASRARRYPVLYLLHGLFGHYTDWTTRSKLT
jgi:enterochelin esterase-like enzyme